MTELASQVGALMFAVEHRFYGYSVPNVTDLKTDNLDRFLSSKQAAADLAVFHGFASGKYRIPPAAKWVTFGGSYPGMLASYARLLYPELFYAAVASSAPVRAAVDFPGYLNVVAQALNQADYEVDGSSTCLGVISEGHAAIGGLLKTAEGRRALERRFSLCGDKPLDDEKNIASWVGFGVIPINAQGNSPSCSERLCGIKQVCRSVLKAARTHSDNALLAMEIVAREANGDGPGCVNVNFTASLENMRDTSLMNWVRVWTFQTCKEFGFYQTCEKGSNCPFTKGYNTLAFNVDQCEVLFGISPEQVSKNVDATNRFYGADRPNSTRVLWVNGGVDPWHFLSVLVAKGPDQPTIWVPGDSHHYWTHPSLPSNTKDDREAREAIWRYVSSWLGIELGSLNFQQQQQSRLRTLKQQQPSVAASFLGRGASLPQDDAPEETTLLQVSESPENKITRGGRSIISSHSEL